MSLPLGMNINTLACHVWYVLTDEALGLKPEISSSLILSLPVPAVITPLHVNGIWFVIEQTTVIKYYDIVVLNMVYYSAAVSLPELS